MKCNHCGLCCRDARTQISVTIGDLYRISQYLKVDISELFDKIGIQPFADPDLVHYDIDLGLELPCKFREKERCTIYPARPLNCRLFPIWILAKAPNEKIPEILKEHKCKYDLEKKEQYAEYTEKMGKQLLEESEMFTIGNKIDIREIEGYEEGMSEDEKVKLIKSKYGIKLPTELIKKLIEQNEEILEKNNQKTRKSRINT